MKGVRLKRLATQIRDDMRRDKRYACLYYAGIESLEEEYYYLCEKVLMARHQQRRCMDEIEDGNENEDGNGIKLSDRDIIRVMDKVMRHVGEFGLPVPTASEVER